MVSEVLKVNYDGDLVGAVSFDTDKGIGAFEYESKFIAKGIELSPIKMPLGKQIYTFPALNYETFKGLPGLIADSLPDDFGNTVLNAWMAAQGRSPNDITPLQRLQYTGQRGMGALEYSPATRVKSLNAATKIDVELLVKIAQELLDERGVFSLALEKDGKEDKGGMLALLSVGMSAGGARPKAVLAFDDDFSEVRSGQVEVPDGFTHYLMKFDGVSEHHKDKQTFGDPLGFGAMEYTYYQMAKDCGINMMNCKLLEEGERRHFITQRFDRVGNNKIHVQTLNALAHVDYRQTGSFSYAELFSVAREIGVSAADAEQLMRRMVFNIVARNHDDHSKNFGFMLKNKTWQITPAYDLAYSYKPGSKWVDSHWMTLNGKRDNFSREDFYSIEKLAPSFTKSRIGSIIDEVIESVSQWKKLAKNNNVPKSLIDEIQDNLRLSFKSKSQ